MPAASNCWYGVAMNIQLVGVNRSEAPILETLMDDYLGELSKHREKPVGAVNAASYPYLPLYWSEQDRLPFFIRWEQSLVGFALIRRVRSEHGEKLQVAEFYVTPEERRHGIGSAAAYALWKRFPGNWELQVHKGNQGAMAFWKSCIGK
jgi:predicted acetyltransferase